MNVSYGFAAALLILIVSVLPAAAFFRVGHGLQIESFIKYGQLQVALDRIERARRADDLRAKQIPDASFKRLVALRAANPKPQNGASTNDFSSTPGRSTR